MSAQLPWPLDHPLWAWVAIGSDAERWHVAYISEDMRGDGRTVIVYPLDDHAEIFHPDEWDDDSLKKIKEPED